ncbi:hypothetical protein OG906_34245 [Streptomyces sp. NBC_01426]|uniref:hypothetical protein n=1 Tax=Streptomyces sp. NBC_01426 TaxID=2975866 RepID=UPI002E3111C5|nr:hypothetical protein [Streptomyces sp. NBC_01426]
MVRGPRHSTVWATPDPAIGAFSYLRAIQAGDFEAAHEFAGAEPRMAELLVDVVERIVVPVTSLVGLLLDEACDAALALEAVGRVLVTCLRVWEQTGPGAAEGTAHLPRRVYLTSQVLAGSDSWGRPLTGALRAGSRRYGDLHGSGRLC